MRKNPTKVTKNDLLRLLYGEVSGHEKAHLLEALQQDAELATCYRELQETHQSLDRATKKPGKGFVARIMAFSKRQRTAESDSLQSV